MPTLFQFQICIDEKIFHVVCTLFFPDLNSVVNQENFKNKTNVTLNFRIWLVFFIVMYLLRYIKKMDILISVSLSKS